MNESTWMSKNVPKLHQSHEITSSYINIFTYEDKKFKLAKTRRKTELLSENEPTSPMRRTWNLYASRHFGADFEVVLEVKIKWRIARWKSLPVQFPTQVEFLNLVSIFPSKNQISQHCFLCVQKVAERSILGCFWPFRQPKTCQNLWVMGRHA